MQAHDHLAGHAVPTPGADAPHRDASGPWLAMGEWLDSSQDLRAGLFMQELRPDGTPVRAGAH